MGKLTELIARLEGADGGDREVDCHLWAMAEGIDLEWQGTSLVAGTEGVIAWVDPGKLTRNFWSNRATTGPGSIPAYTTSLDAIVALIERILPGVAGWSVALDTYDNSAALTDMAGETRGAVAKTLPLAACLAFLRALQAQQETSEDE